MPGHHRQQTSGHRDIVDLPLALVGIALLSAEEAHRFLVVDVLRTIDDLDDCLQSTDSVLAKPWRSITHCGEGEVCGLQLGRRHCKPCLWPATPVKGGTNCCAYTCNCSSGSRSWTGK